MKAKIYKAAAIATFALAGVTAALILCLIAMAAWAGLGYLAWEPVKLTGGAAVSVFCVAVGAFLVAASLDDR